MPQAESFGAQPHKRLEAHANIVELLKHVDIVGLNEVHPAHFASVDRAVTAQLSMVAGHGCTSGNMLFWRPPQRLSPEFLG